MRILIVAFDQVYPLATGAAVSQFNLIEGLSHYCEISLLLPEKNLISEHELSTLKDLLPKVKVYFIEGNINPVKKNNRGWTILRYFYQQVKSCLNKIKLTLKDNINLNLRNHQDEAENHFAEGYTHWNPFYIHSKRYVEKLDEIVRTDQIDIVQLEYTDNLNLALTLPPSVKIVFIEHEYIIQRIESHIISKQIRSVFGSYIVSFYKEIEKSILSKVDGIIVFNGSEKQMLQNLLSLDKNCSKKIRVSPFPVLEDMFQEIRKKKFLRFDKLIFIGGEQHYPNKDAVEYFISEIAEEVLLRFGLQLHVIGRWEKETVKKYTNHPSKVKFLGFVDDLSEVLRNSIAISPIRIGGGLRTKIITSMAQGNPVICTSFALDGINAKHMESVMIAEDRISFCLAIEYLMEDLERTFEICQNAQNLIKREYSKSQIVKQRYLFYQDILYSGSCPSEVQIGS